MNCYVYYVNKNSSICHERTCGIEYAAIDRVEYLKTLYPDVGYFIDSIPKDIKYFY